MFAPNGLTLITTHQSIFNFCKCVSEINTSINSFISVSLSKLTETNVGGRRLWVACFVGRPEVLVLGLYNNQFQH